MSRNVKFSSQKIKCRSRSFVKILKILEWRCEKEQSEQNEPNATQDLLGL
jgi:hypothetical protein